MNILSRCLRSLPIAFGLLAVGAANAAAIDFSVSLATPVIKAGKTQTAFLKVGMTGFALPAQGERPPANVALVIDKSGSMAGDRIARAKQAATMAVHSLGANDIISVIAFDNTVEVVIPATRVTDQPLITRAIQGIQAAGGTGLFAGVSKGAAEVRKFIDKNRVNRVILLSDGLANVGPSSPAELGQLGAALGRQGISVTTIGLGTAYNEDLMTQLAGFSDGNHAFVENARDLDRIFQREFGDVASVVAQEVELTIRLKHGIRPVRILGREGEMGRDTVRLRMNQLYSQQEKYVVVEVEVPPGKAGERLDLASMDVTYLNMQSRNQDKLSRSVAVSFSESDDAVAKATDKKAMVAAVEQVANTMSKQALDLRDQGKVEEAKKLMEKNASYLSSNRQVLGKDGEGLRSMETDTRKQAESIGSGSGENWNVQRKSMREYQYRIDNQQK